MAKIVAGFGSSHSPLMSLPSQLWSVHAQNDVRNGELVAMPAGKRVTYDELVTQADPKIASMINLETFDQRVDNIQAGLDELKRRFGETRPDVVVMFGDDQGEFFFDDNYPTINLYWGESIKMIPRTIREGASEAQIVSAKAYGDTEVDYPVDAKLGEYLIESLCENDFDIASTRYLKDTYGGSIGPSTWYLDHKRSTGQRRFGLPHAFAFPVVRWFDGQMPPIVPITINTCYPPNWISPRRAYDLGVAVRQAVQAWASDKTVAMACSGGLSHFVVDEDLDRLALKGLENADPEILRNLPRHRLQSATTETLNWVAVAGGMQGTKMETITYEPGYRTVGGTGCGCAVGHWHD